MQQFTFTALLLTAAKGKKKEAVIPLTLSTISYDCIISCLTYGPVYIPHRERAAYENYLGGMISARCTYPTYTCFGFLRKLSKITVLSHMSSFEIDRHVTPLIIRSFEC